MTDTENNNAQIEKELLAICYACHKFHQYVYGKPVNVQMDHRPPEAIFKKPLGNATPRLQRMLLRLQRYELDVRYVLGKYMYGADTLSHAYIPGDRSDDQMEDDIEVMVQCLVSDMPVSAMRQEQIRAAAADYPDLQMVRQAAMMEWPKQSISGPGFHFLSSHVTLV